MDADDPRIVPAAALVALLAFAGAFAVLAADLAWNVEASLLYGDDHVVVLREDRGWEERRIPNATQTMTLQISNDRPLGWSESVSVTTGRDGPRPLAPGEEPGDGVVYLDEVLSLAAGERVDRTFTVDPAGDGYLYGPEAKGGTTVGNLVLTVEVGDRVHHIAFQIVEETS